MSARISGLIKVDPESTYDEVWLMLPDQEQLWLADFVRRGDAGEIIRCSLQEATHMIVGIDGDKVYVVAEPTIARKEQ